MGFIPIAAYDLVPPRRWPSRLDIVWLLVVLYVMAATGRATIDAKRKTPQIFFNVLRRPEGER